MAAPMDDENVDLGFVENTESFLLRSRFFPSKIGGKPSWLSLKPLPSTEELSCKNCSNPTSFLMQVYAPDSSTDKAFHRTLFLFVCRDENCCQPNKADNLRVFRSQLPRQNDFYNATPPVEMPVDSEPGAELFNNMCIVCGCLGPKACGKCHKVHYCGKQHQTIDWKKGHKRRCNETEVQIDYDHSWLFPEFELVTEAENLPESQTDISTDTKYRGYEELMKKQTAVSDTSLTESELEKMACKETENDKQLKKFKQRLSFEPEQVLRYNKGGEPLWIAHTPKPTEIPDCSCGAKRQFEFQVLPQLLSHLKVDKIGTSLDWGTLCIYTCTQNCSIDNTYKEEFVFKQDIV